jgi:hypothetical protein
VRVGNLTVSQEHVAVQGQYAYVLDWAKRIRVADLADPTQPTIVGVGSYHDDCYVGPHCFPWFPALGRLVVSGTYAYIPLDGLRIVDVSDPTNPTEAISLSLGATAVVLKGTYAYLNVLGSLYTLDVSNPLSPTVIFSQVFPSEGYQGFDIALAGDYLYLRRAESVHVFDITNPVTPSQVSSYTLGSSSKGPLAASDHYAYVAAGESLCVLDVSGLPQITVTGRYTAPNEISSVAVAEPYVHVVANDLHTLDVSDPTQPVEVASYGGLSANGLTVADGYIISASYWTGLSLFRVMTDEVFLPLLRK